MCLSVCSLLNNFKTAISRDAIFGMYTHMRFSSKIDYVSLTSEVIGGHWRSLEVKTFKLSSLRSQLRDNTQGCKFIHVYAYDAQE